jgi:hypothetical protein
VLLEEIIYNNRDNSIALALSADGSTINHASVTRCQVLVGATLIDSQVTPALFDLTAADRLTFKLGAAGLTVGRYTASLIVYDATHTNGIVWGQFVAIVK